MFQFLSPLLAGWLLIAPAVAAEDAACTVLVLGDSLSAAHNMPMEAGWVHLLDQRLKAGSGGRAINASISGETSSGGLSRLPELLDQHHPAVVIIELGGNDGLRGLPTSELSENLAQMIAISREAGAKVLLAGIRIPTNYGPRYGSAFAAVFPQLAESLEVALVPFILEGIAFDENALQADRIHPNRHAQPTILANVWPHLAPLLEACGGNL